MEGQLWSVCYFLILSFVLPPTKAGTSEEEGDTLELWKGRTGFAWFGFSEEETHGKDMFGKIRNARFGATSVEWWPPCGA